jgi:hypothetical protein
MEGVVEHRAYLEHPLNEPKKIASAILQRLVRQSLCVHRQHNKETPPITRTDLQFQNFGGRKPVTVARALEGLLSRPAVVQV